MRSVLCVAILLMSGSALAQQAGDDYEAVIRDAVGEYNRGNYAEASVLFERAHQARPSARTLRGKGMCAFELKHYVAAVQAFDEALRHDTRPLSDVHRSEVTRLLQRARDFAASFELAFPAGVTQLEVDGESRALPSGPVLLDPGKHVLAVTTAAGERIERELDVEVGERGRLAFDSRAREPGPAPTPSEAPRSFTWIALAATGAFAAGIVGFGLAAKGEHDDFVRLSMACEGCESSEVKSARSSGRTLQTLTNVSIALTGVAAAATVALFVFEPKLHERAQSGVTWSIGPSGAQLKGRF